MSVEQQKSQESEKRRAVIPSSFIIEVFDLETTMWCRWL